MAAGCRGSDGGCNAFACLFRRIYPICVFIEFEVEAGRRGQILLLEHSSATEVCG